ncbi:MAG: hypothetical protein JXQ29_10635 [Planctomycetes bacterium]|nr:hypothetical protein [Planctomycetota bacterium]
MLCRRGGVVLAVLLAVLAGAAAAQDPYGNGQPGTGGFTPVLSCNQAFMGNGLFTFRIHNGLGGGTGLLGVSTRPGRFLLGKTEILIGLVPPDPILIRPIVLGGTPNQPGAGTAIVPVPLAFPPMPALAGAEFFAQFVAMDFPMPGSPATSRGLKIELTYPPLVFVGTSVGGNIDPYYLVDPQVNLLVHQGGATFSDNVTGAAFTYGGRGLFVGSSFTSQVNYADVTTTVPVWRTVYTSAGSGCYGIGYDKANQRLYTLTDPGSSQRELVALDVANPASPSFGTLLANTVNLTGGNPMTERWALARSGKQAAVLVGFINTINLVLVDTDPRSASYLKNLVTAPVPMSGTGGLSLATRVVFTPDEDVVLVLIQNAGTNPAEIARYDVVGAQWLDHDPTQPGIQNIGVTSVPPVAFGSAPADIEMAPDGTFAVVSGFGGTGWAGRLDLNPRNITFFAYQPLSPLPALPGAWACGLARDGSLMGIGTFPNAQLVLADPQTGVLLGTVGLPGASNVYTVEHR